MERKRKEDVRKKRGIGREEKQGKMLERTEKGKREREEGCEVGEKERKKAKRRRQVRKGERKISGMGCENQR